MQNSLFEIFIFLTAACIMVPLTSRFKLSSVLGYLIAGILIGPFARGLITDPANVIDFAQFGVVMMLFVIGLELEPAVLWRLRTSIIGLGGLQLTLTTATFTLLGMILGYHWQLSLAAGMALGLSSTALVLQIRKWQPEPDSFVLTTKPVCRPHSNFLKMNQQWLILLKPTEPNWHRYCKVILNQ